MNSYLKVPINAPDRKFGIDAALNYKIQRLIKTGPYINGPYLEEFESRFSNYLGVSYCLGLSSGTSALELAIKVLDLSPGSLIATSANSGGYASISIRQAGHIPVYVDVNIDGLIDKTSINNSLQLEVKALIVTNLYGQSSDMQSLMDWASKNGVYVIEDCAQSTGALVGAFKTGSLSHISTFSFYPTKNLSSIGDSGAVCTNSSEFATRLKSLREYGWKGRYFASIPGGSNFRMDEIHALILLHQLEDLDFQNSIRRLNWKKYSDALQGSLKIFGKNDESFVAHLAVLQTKQRDFLNNYLNSRGISCAVHYPFPDYKQKAFEIFSKGNLPQTEVLCNSVLTIPLFTEMTEEEVSFVVNALEEISKIELL